MRVGLNTGEPIQEEDDYFGTAVVIAKRLCDAAEPGHILAASVVASLVESRVDHEFRSLGPLDLKGLREPLHGVEVLWQPAATQRSPLPREPAAGVDAAFVGRDSQMAALMRHWERAKAGAAGMVMLGGEPGIGKTRLASQFCQVAHAEGATVLFGRSYEETLTPYQPFLEALDHYAQHCPVDQLRLDVGTHGADLHPLMPRLADRLPDTRGGSQAGTAEGDRYRLFEAVAGLFVAIGDYSPVLLVLDDLQWADKSTLLLLQHVVRAAADAPLLIIGTYREADVQLRNHPLGALMADLSRSRTIERVKVGGLSEPAVGELIAAWAGHPAPELFVTLIYRETEGNPFFTEEVLRHLVDTGVVYHDGTEWTSDVAPERFGVPETVKTVLTRRLARLSDDTNLLLGFASVMGRDFSVDVLEHVSDLSPDAVLDALDEALQAQVITEQTRVAGRYSFAHGLVRETLYEQLTGARHASLHRRIAAAIEHVFRYQLDAHLAELAFHLFDGGHVDDLERAVDYGLRAARAASRQFAYEEAVAYYERCLDALPRLAPDPELRCTVVAELGEALWNAAEFDRARAAFRQGADLATASGFEELLGRCALGFAGRTGFVAGRVDDELIELLELALAVLPDDDSPLRARLLARLAEALTFAPGGDRRAAISAEAITVARRVNDPAVLADVLNSCHWARWGPDTLDERLAIAAEMVALAGELGDADRGVQGSLWRFADLMEAGHVSEAAAEAERAMGLTDSVGEPFLLWMVSVVRGMLMLLAGDLETGDAHVWETFAAGQAVENASAMQLFGVQLFVLRDAQGRIPELRAATQAMADYYPGVPGFRSALRRAVLPDGPGRPCPPRARRARRRRVPRPATRFLLAQLPRVPHRCGGRARRRGPGRRPVRASAAVRRSRRDARRGRRVRRLGVADARGAGHHAGAVRRGDRTLRQRHGDQPADRRPAGAVQHPDRRGPSPVCHRRSRRRPAGRCAARRGGGRRPLPRRRRLLAPRRGGAARRRRWRGSTRRADAGACASGRPMRRRCSRCAGVRRSAAWSRARPTPISNAATAPPWRSAPCSRR